MNYVVKKSVCVTRFSYLLILRGLDSIPPCDMFEPSFAPWVATKMRKVLPFYQPAMVPRPRLYFHIAHKKVAHKLPALQLKLLERCDPLLKEFFVYRWFSQFPYELVQEITDQAEVRDRKIIELYWNSQFHTFYPSPEEESDNYSAYFHAVHELSIRQPKSEVLKWYLPGLFFYGTLFDQSDYFAGMAENFRNELDESKHSQLIRGVDLTLDCIERGLHTRDRTSEAQALAEALFDSSPSYFTFLLARIPYYMHEYLVNDERENRMLAKLKKHVLAHHSQELRSLTRRAIDLNRSIFDEPNWVPKDPRD